MGEIKQDFKDWLWACLLNRKAKLSMEGAKTNITDMRRKPDCGCLDVGPLFSQNF
jgi:hypothetical protein